MSSINVIFTRSMVDDSKDDIMKIKPTYNGDLYIVNYHDKKSKSSYEFEESWHNVMAYLDTCLNLVKTRHDIDPYNSVQFNIPAYPQIMLRSEGLSDKKLLAQLSQAMESCRAGWPTYSRT
jgi:hypothetical protein